MDNDNDFNTSVKERFINTLKLLVPNNENLK